MNHLALIVSVTFHLLIFLLLTNSFFHSKTPKALPQPISVKVLPIAQKTNLPHAAQKRKVVIPRHTKDMKAHRKLKQDPTSPELPVDKALMHTKESLKKTIPKKNIPSQSRRKDEKISPKKTVLDDDFLAVLKTLDKIPDKSVDKLAKADSARHVPKTIEEILSVSEVNALRQQLRQCWIVPPGAQDTREFSFDAVVYMGPDAIASKVKISDNTYYAKNPYYRLAKDAVERAFSHPDCMPLKLPKGKFEQWRILKITFDPREMFE